MSPENRSTNAERSSCVSDQSVILVNFLWQRIPPATSGSPNFSFEQNLLDDKISFRVEMTTPWGWPSHMRN